MKKFLFLLVFIALDINAQTLDLAFEKTKETKPLFKKIYKEYRSLPTYLYEYQANRYYSLSLAAKAIGNYDFSSVQSQRGGWALDLWHQTFIFEDIKKRYEDYYLPLPTEYSLSGPGKLGCYANHPLRFGDLNGDGSNEVVLFLKNDLVLFSPEKEKIIFSEKLKVLEWLSLERTALDPEYKQLPGPSPYQYLSMALSDAREFEPGYRGYSKLYFGDFDSDNNPDILVWRKFYESHKTGDTPGFKKLHDTFAQYELNLGLNSSGEFELQDTDSSTIQQWLSGASYTWQKGYPSKSECKGMEGQLIPEMHDPLLNDPDVLQ
jgi:hypothetical protein